MGYPERLRSRRWTSAAGLASRLRLAAGLAVLGLWLAAGCSKQQLTVQGQPEASCSRYRLDAAQQLFQAARANLVRYYKERGLATLNAAYSLAGDAIQAARATRTCFDFDSQARSQALSVVRAGRLLRTVAYATMRDPGEQTLMTLLQDGYGDAFAGRDID